jgi:hypothetical protein
MDRSATPSFDHETVQRLELLVEEAWQALPIVRRQCITKSHLAQRIIKLADQGVRDPDELLSYALELDDATA